MLDELYFEVWLLPNQNIKNLGKSVQTARPPDHCGFVKWVEVTCWIKFENWADFSSFCGKPE